MRFALLIAIPILAVFLPFASARAQADLELVLKAEAMVAGPRVSLGELIAPGEREPVPRALAAIDLGGAPLPGYSDRLSRREIERLLRAQGLTGAVSWRGAEAVQIGRLSRAFDTTLVLNSAEAYLRQVLREDFSRVELELAEPLPALQLPYGKVVLKPRPIAPAQAAHPRVTLWVDVAVDGTFVRALTVPFKVEAYRPVLVAVRDLPAGATPQCESLAVREANVAAFDSPPLPADCRMVQGHLKRALAQGAPLLKLNVQVPAAVAHGDSVSLQLVEGAVMVESRAVAMADGEVGQRINVRPSAGTEAVMAEIIAPGIVRVSGR
jgi:flagella basal body P-ring formation protein FlgA